jgi:hypothetical protein
MIPPPSRITLCESRKKAAVSFVAPSPLAPNISGVKTLRALAAIEALRGTAAQREATLVLTKYLLEIIAVVLFICRLNQSLARRRARRPRGRLNLGQKSHAFHRDQKGLASR